MILIYGGAYQGKHEYVKENFGLSDEDFTSLTVFLSAENGNAADTDASNKHRIKAIDDTSAFVRECVRSGAEAKELLAGTQTESEGKVLFGSVQARGEAEKFLGCKKGEDETKALPKGLREELVDKIILMDDVSQGLVPLDAEDRAYREMCGRTATYLAQEADEVYRIFCGLAQRLK